MSRPGTVRRRSRTVVALDAVISAASITVAATPRDAADSGSAAAETTTSAASFGAAGGGDGCAKRQGARPVKRKRRTHDDRARTTREPMEHLRSVGSTLPSERSGAPARGGGAAATSRAPEKATLKRCSSGRSPGSRIVRARPLPGGTTGPKPIFRHQWDLAVRVPGHSGGRRAGGSPAPPL